MVNLKKQRYLLVFIILLFAASALSYAISFEEVKSRVEAKIDTFCKIVLKAAHPSSTYENGELYDFQPYYQTKTGYDADENAYEYNLKVVFKIQYKGWVKHHTMKVAVFFNYLMPKDINMESDTNSFKPFGFEKARKMIAKIKSKF